jgi:amino acid adenylation domain-containing protein
MSKQPAWVSSALSGDRRALMERWSSGADRDPLLLDGPIPRRPSHEAVPLSFSQERLWFLEQLHPGQSLYVVPVILRLSVAISTLALQRALDEIVRRHEVLRSAFVVRGERPYQVVDPAAGCPLRTVDLRDRTPEAGHAAARECVAREATTPFDLAQACRLRATLITHADEDHLLICTFHHTAFDGWSTTPFIHELSTLYAAFSRGEESPLAPLPIQYGDYACWQRQLLSDEGRRSVLLEYWKRQLDHVAVAEIAPDLPRPGRPGYRVGRQTLVLPAALVSSLKMLAQREAVTPFIVLLGGLAVVIQRNTASDDVCVGTSVAGRSRTELEPLIGCCLNTLALRADLTGDPTTSSMLRRVRESVLGAFAHQALPFELLLQELQPARDLSRTPFFQVYLNYLNVGEFDPVSARSDIAAAPGMSGGDDHSPAAGDDTHGPFDLALYARPVADELALSLLYARDLFETPTAVRLLRDLQAVLRGMAEQPDERISTLPLARDTATITPARCAVPAPAGWQPIPAEAWETSIGARFTSVARRFPDRIAVRTATTAISYGALEERTARIAASLRPFVSAGERIALLLGHDDTMVAAVLGVLRSGAAYVPLDPRHPRERLQSILAASRPVALLADEPRGALAASIAAGTNVRLLSVEDALRLESAVADGIDRVSPQALAYLIYTSGSTGRPKGVMQNHRNVLRHVRAYADSLHLTPDDSLTLLASYGFDAAVMDIFGALLTGACLIPLDLRAEEGPALVGRLAEATIVHATPTVFGYIADAAGEMQFPRTRAVVLGGESATHRDVERYRRRFSPQARLVNGLGPTESTMALQYVLDHTTDAGGAVVPIGFPVADTSVRLVNAERRDVGALAIGEIAILSEQVALGYWDDETSTAQAFAADPDGGPRRTYFTGDLARCDRSGRMHFIGRRDAQLKILGVRIEPAEIEQRLLEHPGISAAAVIAAGEGPARALAAYIVCSDPGPPDAPSLRRFLRARLPEAMIPAFFVAIDRLPVTINGKIDRAALPPPGAGNTPPDRESQPPVTPTEQQLAALWREVLRIDAIDRTASFFDLGGHSLLAMQVISRLRAAFQRDLPLRVLFETPVLEALALLIDQTPVVPQPITNAVDPASARSARERYKVRLTSGQEG